MADAVLEITGSDAVTSEQMAAITGEIDLSGRGITDISGIEYFTGAESIDLSDNYVANLTPVTALTNLKALDVSTNLLTTLPADIDLMKSLQSLDVSHNRVQALPRQVADLPALQRLYLEDCNLSSLPDMDALYDTLKKLVLKGNPLNGFSFLTNLPCLEMLDLGGCGLQVLPDLSNLSSLRSLCLGGNSLNSLPGYLSNLPLVMLDVSGNDISSLPNSFCFLDGLQKLDLSGNIFAGFPDEIFSMPSLQTLLFADNMLCKVPDLSGLESLSFVSFAGNDITSVSLLNTLPEGCDVNLTYNRIDFERASGVPDGVALQYQSAAGAQKDGIIRVCITRADISGIDFGVEFADDPVREALEGELVPYQIRLFDMVTGDPQLLGEWDGASGYDVSFRGILEAGKSYKLRAQLIMRLKGLTDKFLSYSTDFVIFELATSETPQPELEEPETQIEAHHAQDANHGKGLLWLWIVLGVILGLALTLFIWYLIVRFRY